MATSPTSELGGDVHIPLCGTGRCKDKLLKLKQALEQKGLTCVVEYKISGQFERWFQEAFENCPYTIIHWCRHLWKKISQFESRLSAEDTKVITVDLSKKSKSRSDPQLDDDNTMYDYFSKCTVFTIYEDEKSFSKFVSKVVDNYGDAVISTKLLTNSHQSQDECNGLIQGSLEDEGVEKEESFESYPDLFGNSSNVFVRESCMKCTENEIAEFSDFKIEGWANQRDRFIKEKCTPHSKFVIHKVLPKLFEGQKIIELGYIASCSEAVLQGEAMILMEMLLLNKHNDDRKFTINTQILLESLLHESLLEMGHRLTWDEDKSVSIPISRLAILYMMVLSNMIMSCKDRAEMKLCDIHLGTVAARGRISDQSVNELQIFIEDLSKWPCFQIRNAVKKFIDTDKPELGTVLCKENSAVQACVIVEIMKQMFTSLNDKKLTFLKHYMEAQKKRKVADNNNMPSACMILLIRCLTIFICFGLKKMKHQSLQNISKEALDIINLYLEMSLTEDIYIFLQMLLFDSSPVILEKIFKSKEGVKSKDNVEDGVRESYEMNQIPFLLNQLERLLSPLLMIEETWEKKSEGKSEGKWEFVQGKFDNQTVLLHVHSPVIISHRKRNESGCKTSEDVYCNEMRVLKVLQHKNILKMFAFEENHIPVFYIVEDYSQTKLQTVLKNKRENQDYFSQTILLKFLLDAVTALEYCHSKFHVHCNLTSESLFITNNMTAKLCGFHLCLELVDGRGKIDKKEKSRPIFIRWTAPESLHESEYTIASDIWMFGHLMYEVLTHGQLPYPYVEDLSKLQPLIVGGKISLPEEPCFKREHYNLISECTVFNSGSRSTLNDIKDQLEHFYRELDPQAAVYYFDTSYKDLTTIEKGIPSVHDSKYWEDHNPCNELQNMVISDTIMRFTSINKYIFREKIVHKVTQNMAIKVEDRKLSDVLTGVKIYQHNDEVHHIECSIPVSCQGSLLEVTFERALGTTLKPYLHCLLQVASVLKQLHERSWVLGDMCASTLYVEQTNQGLKIYVVSLAYLLPCEKAVARISPPENTHICARAAPEVIRGGIFSPESDVYCFGFLMWEVLTAFDHLQENVEQFMTHLESTHDTGDKEYDKKVGQRWEDSHVKPYCCPDNLFELIKKCVDSASTRRITLNALIEQLQRISEDLQDDYMSQDSVETTIP